MDCSVTAKLVVYMLVGVSSMYVPATVGAVENQKPNGGSTIIGKVYVEHSAFPKPHRPVQHRRLTAARGIKVVLINGQGVVVARTVSRSGGVFSFSVRPGSYEVAGHIGQPYVHPGKPCGKPTHITVKPGTRSRPRLVCTVI